MTAGCEFSLIHQNVLFIMRIYYYPIPNILKRKTVAHFQSLVLCNAYLRGIIRKKERFHDESIVSKKYSQT